MRPAWSDEDTQELPIEELRLFGAPRVIRSHRAPKEPHRFVAAWTIAVATVGVLIGAYVVAPSRAESSSPQGDVYANGQVAMYSENWCHSAVGTTRHNDADKELRNAWYYQHNFSMAGYTNPVCPSPSPSPTSPSPSPTVTGSPSPSPTTASPSPTSPSPSPTTSSPSPSPTVTPSPSPTGGPLLDCMRQADRCGWPTAATTGPRSPVVLTRWPTSTLTIRAGETYRGIIVDHVVITGSNAKLLDSKLTCTGGPMCVDMETAVPLSNVELGYLDVDLSHMTEPWNVRAISGSGFWLHDSNLHGGGDFVHYDGDIVIERNNLEVPECVGTVAYCDSLHIDALHSASGHPDPNKRHVRIYRNTIIMWGHNTLFHANSAIINGPDIPPYQYPQDDVQIVENLMAGGGAVVYCQAHPEDPANFDKTASIWNNRISDIVWPRGGRWGPFYNDCMDPPAPGRLTNVWDRTGVVIPLGSWG